MEVGKWRRRGRAKKYVGTIRRWANKVARRDSRFFTILEGIMVSGYRGIIFIFSIHGLDNPIHELILHIGLGLQMQIGLGQCGMHPGKAKQGQWNIDEGNHKEVPIGRRALF
jgi:hypothetical protein